MTARENPDPDKMQLHKIHSKIQSPFNEFILSTSVAEKVIQSQDCANKAMLSDATANQYRYSKLGKC